MANYWITSDLHLDHSNIIEATKRPFKDVQEMNDTIINNYNLVVKKQDIVIILGDLCFNKHTAEKYLPILNGRKIFVKGNHDKWVNDKRFDKSLLFDTHDYWWDTRINDQIYVFCHFPFESWNRKAYGAMHMHGHTHNLEINKIKNRFNAGVDVNNFFPVKLPIGEIDDKL